MTYTCYVNIEGVDYRLEDLTPEERERVTGLLVLQAIHLPGVTVEQEPESPQN